MDKFVANQMVRHDGGCGILIQQPSTHFTEIGYVYLKVKPDTCCKIVKAIGDEFYRVEFKLSETISIQADVNKCHLHSTSKIRPIVIPTMKTVVVSSTMKKCRVKCYHKGCKKTISGKKDTDEKFYLKGKYKGNLKDMAWACDEHEASLDYRRHLGLE